MASNKKGVNWDAVVAEVVELMEANLEEPLTPVEMARLLGVPYESLLREFRKRYDTTMVKHYVYIRLTEAEVLLRETDLLIKTVAQYCGYNNSSGTMHFAGAFKRRFGYSPIKYRGMYVQGQKVCN